MGKGAIFSGLLHLAVVLLAIFGLPWLYDTNEELQVAPVTVISEAQFAELKNQKPPAQQRKQEQPKDKEIPPAPPAPEVAQPQPEPEEPAPPEPARAAEPAPQPQPPPEPQQQAEEPPPVVQPEPPPEPQQQAVAPEPPPQPKPEPVPPPEPQVAEAQTKPVPPKKPAPPKKKDDAKLKEKPKDEQVASDDASFLKDIEKKLKKNQKKSESTPQQQAALPQDNYDGPPLSEGEKDLIKQQIEENSLVDPGMPGIEGFIVEVKVVLNPDGTVQTAKADFSKSNGHPNWGIFARTCERSVYKSSPLRMPADKPYAAWKEMTLVFHGKEMAHL
jgi:hypothetical protein